MPTGKAASTATGSEATVDERSELRLSRRDFLRLGVGGVTVTCLLPASGCSGEAAPDDRTPILWIETGVCTGCSCSLLGSPAPTAEILVPELRLEFQETLMEGFGAAAVDTLLGRAAAETGRFILVVDGAIAVGPTADTTTVGTDGNLVEHSAATLVALVAAQAGAVVALGTCASFGGIPGSTGGAASSSVADVIGKTPVRIPGCPPNPFWITSALSALLRREAIALDALGRPVLFFGKTVHDLCPRKDRFLARDFAKAPGDTSRCLYQVGCNGTRAKADCPTRLWQGRSYCIKANHPCIGCTTPGFLDARPTIDGNDVGTEGLAMAPLYANREVLP